MEKILHFNANSIEKLEKRYRTQLINSISGYKSANLIGTVNADLQTNLAIFSSVVHIGAHPPLIGFIMRPTSVERHTYENIKATQVYTINHVHKEHTAQAHQTAARYERTSSEFVETGLTPYYIKPFKAPFVKESTIQIGCRYVNEYPIKENGTLLIIGAIEYLLVPEEALLEDGWVDLEKSGAVAVNGLDGYATATLINRYQYAKPNQSLETLPTAD